MTVLGHRALTTELQDATSGGDHVVRLAVRGELDTATAAQFALAGQEAVVGPSRRTLAIDMGRVTFIDAAGLGALAKLRNLAGRSGNAVVVIEPSACVVRLLELTEMTVLTCSDPHLRSA